MAKKRKTLPKEIQSLLESENIEALKEQFSKCEPDAVTGKYGSNIFSVTPLPREFAFWAKKQGGGCEFQGLLRENTDFQPRFRLERRRSAFD